MREIFLTIIIFLTVFLPKTETVEPEIKLFAVGDIMLDRGVEHMIGKHGEGDFKFPFLKIVDYLEKSDILFGNLESVISDKGYKVGSIYSFRAKPEAIEGLVFAGFDVLSVANNHALDYTIEAFKDNLKRLEEAGINYIGGGFDEKEVRAGVLKEIKGTKIHFLGYNNIGLESWRARGNNPGIGWLDYEMIEDIENSKGDIIIVSMHFGQEYETKQNQNQEYWAQMAIDAGADLVIGHHPHVLQPIKEYNQGWIAYSLGNFVFDQYFSQETMESIILKVTIQDKEITMVEEEKVIISDKYQPFVD